MKQGPALISIICLCSFLSACSKSDGNAPATSLSSFHFTAGDTLIIYTVNIASIENVYNTRTTLITGQYQDTTKQKGSLSIRVLSDTTGRYTGSSLLVTYVNPAGISYYNTTDSSNYVEIDKYEKKYNGEVSGHFSMKVSNGTSGIQFTNGAFTALFQE